MAGRVPNTPSCHDSVSRLNDKMITEQSVQTCCLSLHWEQHSPTEPNEIVDKTKQKEKTQRKQTRRHGEKKHAHTAGSTPGKTAAATDSSPFAACDRSNTVHVRECEPKTQVNSAKRRNSDA